MCMSTAAPVGHHHATCAPSPPPPPPPAALSVAPGTSRTSRTSRYTLHATHKRPDARVNEACLTDTQLHVAHLNEAHLDEARLEAVLRQHQQTVEILPNVLHVEADCADDDSLAHSAGDAPTHPPRPVLTAAADGDHAFIQLRDGPVVL